MLEVDVEARLGDFTLDAAFSVPADRITALFGRSGSGKTSLVNCLAGLTRPRRGRIVVAGEVLYDSGRGIHLPPERRRLGYVFQEGRLFPHLSVRGNLLYGAGRLSREDRDRSLAHVVDLLGIGELLDRRPRDLSGGEKQRVAIGRALLASPRLILMDEPLASLDPPRKAEILPFIERLRDEEGIPIVYVSHSMDEIVRLADTLVLMDRGRVAAAGGLPDLTARLDLSPLTGRYEAGAVIEVTVDGHRPEVGLSVLASAAGPLLVPTVDLPEGDRLRLRIRARDVSLALVRPEAISTLNILPGVVREIGDDGGTQVDILVDVGVPLWARVTKLSFRELGLAPGIRVHALIKAIAFDSRALGGGRVPQRER